jgi:hypothetical protein
LLICRETRARAGKERRWVEKSSATFLHLKRKTKESCLFHLIGMAGYDQQEGTNHACLRAKKQDLLSDTVRKYLNK